MGDTERGEGRALQGCRVRAGLWIGGTREGVGCGTQHPDMGPLDLLLCPPSDPEVCPALEKTAAVCPLDTPLLLFLGVQGSC